VPQKAKVAELRYIGKLCFFLESRSVNGFGSKSRPRETVPTKHLKNIRCIIVVQS